MSSHDGVAQTTATEAVSAFCQGTPLRGEIERHPTIDLERAEAISRKALLDHFGDGPVEAATRGLAVEAVPS